MASNFALSLSFEGIRLLHRVSGGWHLVGEASFDDPDLPQTLSHLRKTAAALEPSGIRTKLLIPDDQIKYISIDSAQTTLDDVHEALDGATPYPLKDLVIDFDRSGGRTHIAAVARETLAEAEDFAVEHGFAPIAFAAIAPEYTFATEVFFGPTSCASDPQTVMRDDKPVEIVGAVTLPDPEPPVVQPQEPKDETETAELVFSSRNRRSQAEPTAEPEDARELELADAGADTPEVLFTPRRTPPPAPPVAAPSVAPPPVAPAAPRVDPIRQAAPPAPKETAAPSPPPQAEKRVKAKAKTPPPPTRKRPRFMGLVLTACLLLVLYLIGLWASTWSEDGIAGWFRPAGIEEIPQTASAPIEEMLETTPAIAPQDGTTQTEAAPLPIVRAPPGRVLSPAEADRIYAATGVYQRAPRFPEVPQETSLDGMIRAVAHPSASAMDALALPDIDLMFPDLPLRTQINPPPAGTTYQRDLRGFILAMPDGTRTPDGVWVYAGAPTLEPPLRPGTTIAEPTAAIPTAMASNAGLRLIPGPPPLTPPLRPDSLAQNLAVEDPAPVEALPSTSADGPEITDVATSLDAEIDAVAAAIAEAAGPDAEGAAPELQVNDAGLAPQLRPVAFSSRSVPALETAPTSEAAEDAVATVVPVNPTDAVTPSGATLASFRPAPRPAALVPVDLLALADPALRGLRPSARPETITVAFADNDAINSAIEEANTRDITSVIENLQREAAEVSPFAVAASLRPDARPRNFATVVARAQTSAPRTQTTVASAGTVRAAPAVPSGPISGGVARAATMENAIRLRDINLIGVYGRPGDRRALVRLSNGRYVKVEIGSSLDGGQVTAINDSALNYVKRGRTYALQLPSG